MKHWKTIVALLLIAGGIFVLVQGGFSYTEETHELNLGPLELTAKDKERVEIPKWVGIGAIAAGAVILLVSRRR